MSEDTNADIEKAIAQPSHVPYLQRHVDFDTDTGASKRNPYEAANNVDLPQGAPGGPLEVGTGAASDKVLGGLIGSSEVKSKDLMRMTKNGTIDLDDVPFLEIEVLYETSGLKIGLYLYARYTEFEKPSDAPLRQITIVPSLWPFQALYERQRWYALSSRKWG